MEHLPGLGESLEGGNISSSEGPRILVENISRMRESQEAGQGTLPAVRGVPGVRERTPSVVRESKK